MESTEVIIARLVLGYLKDERCRSSYKEFLKSSNHLQDHKIASTKYIPTRFLGLTLGDILTEYFEVSQIVQGRLESTSYYDECHPKSSLIQQVLYLLNRVQSSRVSTPCPSSCRSPSDMHVLESSPSHRDHHSDVETTPAHTLPGNVQYESEESVCLKTPKRIGHKYAKSLDTSSIQVEQDQTPEVIDTEELAKTLLENTEFHEKIARTINKVAEKQYRVSAELDKTIKTVVQETELDPIFDKILDEIVVSSGFLDGNKGLCHNSMTSCVEESSGHKQKKAMDQENCEAPQNTYNTFGTSVRPQNGVMQDNNEVIVFNGPLETYLGSTTNVPQPQPVQNPIYMNPTCSGLIMPSIPSSSQIVLLNQPTPVPWQAPAAPYLSEQDIMSMPTVIVNDTMNNGMQKPKHILPMTAMPRIEIPNLNEFLNFHPKKVDNKKKPNQGLKKVIYPVSVPKPNAPSETDAIEHVTKSSSENKLPDLSEQIFEEENQPEHIIKTPPPLETIRKATPKSGSHIRNLDFSTPPKITSTHKKFNNKNHGKSTQFVHKKQAAKSLFNKDETKTKKPVKPMPVWDHDIRAALPEMSPKKVKRVPRIKKKGKKVKLNTTAQDAALLEAALQTPIKKEVETREVVKEKSNEETKPESTDKKQGSDNKTILSPSKLNNTKRNIMNVKDSEEEPNTSNLITPEVLKEPSNFPIKANRNITPMLETPFKDIKFPKTPGVDTPGDHNLSMMSNSTPFTKMLEANLIGMNIDMMPTPSIPITPNFPPFTPTVDLISPYSNRPTDYSTGGSSYYLPSDNEQNKSLEAHLKQEERKPTEKVKTKENHLDIFNKNVIGKKNLSLMKQNLSSPSSSGSSSDKDDSWGDKGSNDTIIFNKKETPRKYYSLRTRKVPETEKTVKNVVKASDKKKSSEVKKEKIAKARRTSAERKDNKKETVDKKTMVAPEKEKCDENVSVSEELRESMLVMTEAISNRIEELKTKTKPKEKQAEVIESEDNASEPTVLDEKSTVESKNKDCTKEKGKTKPNEKQSVSNKKAAMLRELEKKRQRMINAIRGVTESIQPAKAQRSHRFKIKPIPNVTCTRKKQSPKKTAQPKTPADPKKPPQPKKSEAETLNVLRCDLYDSEDSDDISLRLSPCEEEVKTRAVKTDSSASDLEAQNLIEGLKERGIHLMHNKSPKKNAPREETAAEQTEEEQNCSSSHIDTLQRDTYDTKLFAGEDLHIVFDETVARPADGDPDRFKDPVRSFIGKVYLEELGGEIDVQLRFTECSSLLDIRAAEAEKVVESSKKIVIQEMVVIKNQTRSEDELMDFAATGNDGTKTLTPTKSTRKRKLSENGKYPTDKATKMLKRLNVDEFLNNIHANTNFHVKK